METIFMNTKKSKTNKSHMAGKLDFKNPNKNIILANLKGLHVGKH